MLISNPEGPHSVLYPLISRLKKYPCHLESRLLFVIIFPTTDQEDSSQNAL